MTEIRHRTDIVVEAIAEWAKDKPQYTELPDAKTVTADLDFVIGSSTWDTARIKAIEAGLIGKSGNYYYVP